MLHYRSDIQDFYVFSKKHRKEGTLILCTEIHIRGNHKKGPVPVSIIYSARFTADEKYQENDIGDEEINWVSYEHAFDEQHERDSYIDNFFQNI